VLGGLVRWSDASVGAPAPAKPKLRLNARRFRDGRVRLSIGGYDRRYVTNAEFRFGKRSLGKSAKSPFRLIVRIGHRGTIRAYLNTTDGRRFTVRRRAP
jgi:hypothetical protein